MPIAAEELERELLTSPLPVSEKTEPSITAYLDRVAALSVNRGIIVTAPVGRLAYRNVSEMRVYGEHEAEFPREGIRFKKPGERPIESVSVEDHPQNLVVRGRVRPIYRVNGMVVDPDDYTAQGRVTSSILQVKRPTAFRHWAEYISDEERALLETQRAAYGGRKIELVPGKIALGLGMSFVPLGLTSVAALLSPLYEAAAALAAPSLGPGIIYALSLSPNVQLTFPDGRVDTDTGAQVAFYQGKVLSDQPQPRIETSHSGDEIVRLPREFSVVGDFSVEGTGRWQFPDHTARVYSGRFSGRLDAKGGFSYLSASVYA